MVTIGLVGRGNFGKRVERILEQNPNFNLVWIADSKTYLANLPHCEWVYICSSIESLYENALIFMSCGSNIILEKPPTLNIDTVNLLIKDSIAKKVSIYFSMTYIFDSQIKYIKCPQKFTWIKNKKDNSSDGPFSSLLFHHLYIYLKGNDYNYKNNYEVKKIYYKSPEDFSFSITVNNQLSLFTYKRSKNIEDYHSINDIVITKGKLDTIPNMLNYILNNKNYEINNNLARSCVKILDIIRSVVFPKKVVVGAGIFGCSAAIELSKQGYNIDLLERHSDIMSEASGINQYRIHRGYHYPRSDETVDQCKKSYKIFEKIYYRALLKETHNESYYAIAKYDSKTTPKEYVNFLNKHDLEYQEKNIGLLNTSLTIKVNEKLYDPIKLKSISLYRLNSMGVNLKLNINANKNTIDNYTGGVISTYASQGYWNEGDINYQFELCEKPIALLPEMYKGLSIVIMDGPFMCIDPFSSTNYHVLGNVVHAIHKTSYGAKPEIPFEYKKVLNKGCIKPSAKLTKFKNFINAAAQFFPEIKKAKHIGSMYTIRAVEANRDHDDARVSSVYKKGKYYHIFSGKVCTSINIAKQISYNITNENN